MTVSSDIFKYTILMNLTDTIEAEKAKKESRIKLETYINKRWGEKENYNTSRCQQKDNL